MAKRKRSSTSEGDFSTEEETKESSRPATFMADPHDVRRALQVGPQEVDMTGFKGEYYKKDEPPGSEPYGLKRLRAAPYDHTFILQNQEHHWEGTRDQFEKQFSQSAPEELEIEEEVDTVSKVRSYRLDDPDRPKKEEEKISTEEIEPDEEPPAV